MQSLSEKVFEQLMAKARNKNISDEHFSKALDKLEPFVTSMQIREVTDERGKLKSITVTTETTF